MDGERIMRDMNKMEDFLLYSPIYFSPSDKKIILQITRRIEREMLVKPKEGKDGGALIASLGKAVSDFESAVVTIGTKVNDGNKRSLFDPLSNFKRAVRAIHYKSMGFEVEESWFKDELPRLGAAAAPSPGAVPKVTELG